MKNLKLKIFTLLFTIAFYGHTQAPLTISNGLQNILDNSLPASFSNSGAIMRIIVPGEWSWSGATGYAITDITTGQAGSIATEGMQFRVGSITKMMVATCIMKLEQDGLLSIDHNINTYLRESIVNDTLSPSGPITIRQLLNHTSGVSNSADNNTCQSDVLANPLNAHSLEDAIYCGGSQGEIATPGLLWAYSNTNYSLLAMIIEEVTGQSYSSYMTQTIITPLELSNTTTHPSDQLTIPHMGCYWNIGTWIDLTIINSTTYTGWADVASTTEDLITFYTALLNENIINSTQLDRMKTIDAISFDYGMGLDYYEFNGVNYSGHYGEVANTSALFFADINSTIAPNGYYISYNFNIQGANTTAIDEQVIDLLNEPVGLTDEVINKFSLFPNPTKDNCFITLEQSTNDRIIDIFDLRGLKVHQDIIPAFESSLTINLSDLEKGVYFLKIEGVKTQRVIVE